MRKIILGLAVSLDGYIEGPRGEYDWCFTDQDYGLNVLFQRIDSLFIGRKTFELMNSMGENASPGFPKFKEYIFSTTLDRVKGDAILIKSDVQKRVELIKNESGKDIWLFGGAELTTSLMNFGLVDEISLAVHPIILGGGKPFCKDIKNKKILQLTDSKPYSTGLVSLSYNVLN